MIENLKALGWILVLTLLILVVFFGPIVFEIVKFLAFWKVAFS